MARILIIDDEDGILETLRTGLEARGYEVETAESGNSGFDLARRNPPDLVLTDVKMRDGDGYAALTAFRADPKTSTIPVIMMTGQATQGDMRQGMEMGADDFLPKPFSIKAAAAAIEARLKKQATIKRQASQAVAALQKNLTLILPHELRTPLTTIVGIGNLLSASANDLSSSEVVKFGTLLVESSERLQRLCENFWFFARLEMLSTEPTRLHVFRPEDCIDVQEVVETAARQRAEAVGRSSDLRLLVSDGGARITGEFLGKVVSELTDNAFKFSEPASLVEVQTTHHNGKFILRVQDAGRGMEPDEASRIGAFMQFQRDAFEQQGVGLGLAIVRKLVDLHGGKFGIVTSPGSGATVTVTIPD